MMEKLTINHVSPGRWVLSGDLSVLSLSEDWCDFDRARPKSGDWTIDCSALEKIDSAGIAYLLSCLRYAKQNDISLAINNIPQDAHGLMKAQGVASFF